MVETIVPNDSLRLFLTFLDELKQVNVLAATNTIGSQLSTMGAVRGKEELRDLLDATGVDHYIICSGELLTAIFTAYEKTPKQIVDGLEKEFKRAQELQLKILRGETLTDEERSFTVRPYLHVCSSSVKTDDGLERVRAWFRRRQIS